MDLRLFAVAAVLLAGCSETSLNEAPVVDRSTRPRPVIVGPAAASAVGETYVVQKGDTLYRIATQFHCSVQDLVRWNALDPSAPIAVGQALRVQAPAVGTSAGAAAPVAPVVAPAAAEVTRVSEAPVEASAVPIAGSTAVETRALEAVPGATPLAPLPAADAAGAQPSAPVVGASVPLIAPAPAVAAPHADAPAVTPAAPTSSQAWAWPVEGKVVGAFDGQRSKGIEIATVEDAQILAAADGEVSYTGSPRDYGNLVILRHPDGLLSVYAHAKSILVQQGQAVTRGQAVAVAGKTTGKVPSVHFEVRRKGVPIDPMELLPAR